MSPAALVATRLAVACALVVAALGGSAAWGASALFADAAPGVPAASSAASDHDPGSVAVVRTSARPDVATRAAPAVPQLPLPGAAALALVVVSVVLLVEAAPRPATAAWPLLQPGRAPPVRLSA